MANCLLRGLLLLAAMAVAMAREVCMTCYADSGPCYIPDGYNINCIYVSIIAGRGQKCWTSAADVYGSFNLKNFQSKHGLTVYPMANVGSGVDSDLPQKVEECRKKINALGRRTSWPHLSQAINVDWEPCDGAKQFPADVPVRMNIGGRDNCLDNAPPNVKNVEMVYDGNQYKYVQKGQEFDCNKRYMFASEAPKINGPQSGSAGGLTPEKFIKQCGDDADYDVYVTGKQYLGKVHTAACGECADYPGGHSTVQAYYLADGSSDGEEPRQGVHPTYIAVSVGFGGVIAVAVVLVLHRKFKRSTVNNGDSSLPGHVQLA